jgi:purine-binding chemotaxis protein CheW
MDIAESKDEALKGLVTFKIGEEEFGVDLLTVQTIIRMTEPTRVPKSPDFVEGVINLRGSIIPVIDFRKKFNLPKKEVEKDTRIIVTEIDQKVIGFIVDSVSEVLRIPTSSIEPPPPIIAGIDSEYISGVGKLEDRLLILVNLNKLLSETEKKEVSQLEDRSTNIKDEKEEK